MSEDLGFYLRQDERGDWLYCEDGEERAATLPERVLWKALAATPAPAPEADKKNEWRELALKFGGQRMAALSHLRMLLEHGEAHAEAVRKFLAEPPQATPAPEAEQSFNETKALILAMPLDDVRSYAIALLIQVRFLERHGSMSNAVTKMKQELAPAQAQQAEPHEVDIVRSAVAAMPHTNPAVADDLLSGFTMHTEMADVVAIYRAGMAAATPAPAPEADALKKAHEARRQAQSEAAYLKARLAGARLILMRELREQGWTPPAPAQAQQAEAEPLPCPFCGHVGLDFADGSTHRWGLASCAGCGATCGETRRTYPPDDKWHANAVKDWNTRAKPEAQQPLTREQVKALLVAGGYEEASHPDQCAFINGIRYAELAHGIGASGEKQG